MGGRNCVGCPGQQDPDSTGIIPGSSLCQGRRPEEAWLCGGLGPGPLRLTSHSPQSEPWCSSHCFETSWDWGQNTAALGWVRTQQLSLYCSKPVFHFVFFCFGVILVLRASYWLCAQGSLLALLGELYGMPGIEFRWATCKANTPHKHF